MEYAELYPKAGDVQRIYCNHCGDNLDLRFMEFHEEVSGIDIHIMGLPELWCKECNLGYLPDCNPPINNRSQK